MRSFIYAALLTGITEGAVVHSHDCLVLTAPYLGASGCVEAGSRCADKKYPACNRMLLDTGRETFNQWAWVVSEQFTKPKVACMTGRADAVKDFETMVRGEPKNRDICEVDVVRHI